MKEEFRVNDVVKYKNGERHYKVLMFRHVNAEGKNFPIYTIVEVNTQGRIMATSDELEKVPVTQG